MAIPTLVEGLADAHTGTYRYLETLDVDLRHVRSSNDCHRAVDAVARVVAHTPALRALRVLGPGESDLSREVVQRSAVLE